MIRQWKWRLAQFIEIRWWRNYLGQRDTTEYLAWKRNYWLQFLQTCNIELPSGKNVLDAGSGPAGIFIVLQGNRVLAVDPLVGQYEKLLPHFDPQAYPWVRFDNSTVEEMQSEDAFDLVFCLNALNHFNDMQAALRQIRLRLPEGGMLLLSVDVHRYRWLQRIFAYVPGDVLHPHQRMLSDYLALLESSGFRVERTQLLRRDSIFDYQAIVAQ